MSNYPQLLAGDTWKDRVQRVSREPELENSWQPLFSAKPRVLHRVGPSAQRSTVETCLLLGGLGLKSMHKMTGIASISLTNPSGRAVLEHSGCVLGGPAKPVPFNIRTSLALPSTEHCLGSDCHCHVV